MRARLQGKTSTTRTTSNEPSRRALARFSSARWTKIGLTKDVLVDGHLDLSPVLRQAVKSQNSLNGELTHGFDSTEVHAGAENGRDPAIGCWVLSRGSGPRF